MATIQQTLNEVLDILKKNKLKITRQRKTLLTYLLNHKYYYHNVTIVDQYMRHKFPNMSHNTIYRNIRVFEDAGIVEQQMNEDQTKVKYQCDFNHMHHHHFICQNCSLVIELEECPFDMFKQQLPGYQINNHQVELYGMCLVCQKAIT